MEENYKYFDTNDFNLEEICTCKSIPEGKYLVLGDNRPISKDSRYFGSFKKDKILGRVTIRLFPFSKFGLVK